MRKIVVFLMATALSLPAFAVGEKEQERVEEAGTVLKEIMNIPEGIPQSVLDKAECVVVLPSVKKLAIGIGGSYGRGAMSCRTGSNYTGPWGTPVMMALEGGSIGFQLGGQATDFVLLFMNPRAANAVLSSKVKLGADVSAAAGPKGRSATAETDASMRAEILSYSRSRGLFAGISLTGSTLRPDNDADEHLYGHTVNAKQLVQQGGAGSKAGSVMVSVLNQHSPTNKSDKTSLKDVDRSN